MPVRDAGTITALAQETATDPAVVQRLYEEEVAGLEAKSSIKNFISVIAARRVRERLTARREDRRSSTARSVRESRVA
jgi:hypothetical protein